MELANKHFIVGATILLSALSGATYFAFQHEGYKPGVGAPTVEQQLATEESIYAHLDANGVVDNIIVIDQEMLNTGHWGATTSWVRTSAKGTIRKNYAGKGYKYDASIDAFVAPKTDANATLDTQKGVWIDSAKTATSSK